MLEELIDLAFTELETSSGRCCSIEAIILTLNASDADAFVSH